MIELLLLPDPALPWSATAQSRTEVPGDICARASLCALIPPKPRDARFVACASAARGLSMIGNGEARAGVEHERNSRRLLQRRIAWASTPDGDRLGGKLERLASYAAIRSHAPANGRHCHRAGRAMKRKICIYVSEDLVSRLAVAAEQRGATKSGLVGAALDRFLDATEDHDDRPGADEHLVRMGRQLDHLERELRFVNETVAMHARYHLAVTPPLPDAAQPAACRIGAARFDEFAAQVGRRVDLGKPLIRETLDRLGTTDPQRPFPDGQGPLSPSAGHQRQAAREAMNDRSSEARQEPVAPMLSGRRAATGPLPSHPAVPATDPSGSDRLQAGRPQPARQTPGQDDQKGARPPIKDRTSGLHLILRVFLPFAVGYYLSYLFRTISALIAGPLTTEFGLTPSSLGLLMSAYFLSFAAAQIPIGVFLDRYGPRQVQAVLLVIAAGGAALFGASDGFLSLLAGRALIGLGVAAALTAGLKATVLWFPKERVALVNGWMVMLGALGAVTATTPSEWLLAWIGWRGLFEWLAMATAVAAAAVYLLVPEAPPLPSTANSQPFAGLKQIYADPRFWRLAPLSATTIGTAWALQGLWAAPWFSDVEGLDRAAVVNHLLAMAVALSIGALLLGVLATRLRQRNVQPQAVFGFAAALSIAVQLALILRWPVPSYILWGLVAAIGAVTVLSYAIMADYFPKELAGRANAALNVFHIGGAFVLQDLIGVIIEHWPVEGTHHPMIAYQAAFGVDLALQLAAWIWFTWPRTQAVSTHFTNGVGRQTVRRRRFPLHEHFFPGDDAPPESMAR
jgi:MFS family permease